MTRDLTLGDDRIGELDVDALGALFGDRSDDPDPGGRGDREPPPSPSPSRALPGLGDPIIATEHGFDGTGDGSGGCLASFIASRADECRPFILPAGRYRWKRPVRFTGGDGSGKGEYDEAVPERFALVGAPEATIHVDIESDDPMDRTMFRFGSYRSPVGHVELHNFHVDVGDADPERDAGICRASVRSMAASNLSLSKRCRLNDDGSRNGDRFSYKVDVIGEDGVATHRNIDLTAGDVHVPSANAVGHAIPFASEPPHEGLNRWLGCRVAGYTDNGFYIRNYSETGRNIVEGCLARNCGGGHIRVGRNDQVRSCHIVVDGREEPANGAGLWVENAKATTVDGVTIEAPAMDNDMVRVTGAISGASIRNLDATLGDTGEFALKARGGYPGGHLSLEGWTVRDACTGRTREASYSVDQPNVTFRGLDHHGTGGRIPFCTREEGFTVADSTVVVDDQFLARLGTSNDSVGSRIVDAIFDDVTVIDIGDGSQTRAFGVYNDPALKRIVVRDCDWTRNSYGRLFGDTKLNHFAVGYIRDCVGW